MIPISLRISGFLSYLEPAQINFEEFDLACISGSNGAGKSSLLDAITWALFGQARRRDDALLNTYASMAEVVFDFRYESNVYRVSRSKVREKPAVLEFYIRSGEGWKALSERSGRETEARLGQTLRLDYETFTNASFFLQGKADQFAQQRPADRKRILGSILGLETWETYREQAAQARKQIEIELGVLDSMLGEVDEELAQEEPRRLRLKNLTEEMKQAGQLRQTQENTLASLRQVAAALDEQRRLMETLKTQVQNIAQRLDDRRLVIQERNAEREEVIRQVNEAAIIEAAYQQWQTARQQLENWERVAANFREHENRRSAPLLEIETERVRLEQEHQSLETTHQQMNSLSGGLAVLEEQIASFQKGIAQLKTQLEQIPVLEDQLRTLVEAQSNAGAENKQLKVEMDELKERIDRLKQTSGAICPLCGQPLSQADRQKLVEELEQQGKSRGDRYRANLDILKNGEGRRSDLDTQITTLKKSETELRQQERGLDQALDRLAQARQTLAEWDANGSRRLGELDRILAQGDYAHAARQALAAVDAELKTIGYDAESHDKVRRSEMDGRSSESRLRALEAARAALNPLEREIEALNRQQEEEERNYQAQHKACQEAQQRYEMGATTLPDLLEAEKKVFDYQEQENRLRMQVGAATQEVEVIKGLRQRREEYAERRSQVTRQIGRYKVLERACGRDGVPALLIEQALPELESQANEVLDRLSDGKMSVRFETQREFKDKSRDDKKETLDILISDSAGIREYEMFSGGEAFRVNFAIRLALSRVLARRAGARLQTLVIDEGFGSQDAEGRQRLIEAINLVRADFEKILVITHMEELKEAFPARIEIEKTMNGSQARVLL